MSVHESVIQQFDQLINAGKFGQARSIGERILSRNPNDLAGNDMVRTALMGLEMPRLALPFARRATELAPDSAGLWISLCACHMRLGEYEPALAAAKKAIELDPSRPSYRCEAGSALMNLGRLAECEDLCREAMRDFPRDADLVPGLCAALLEQGRAHDAQKVLSDTLFNNPGDVMAAAFQCSNANYCAPVDRAAFIAMHRNFGRVLSMADLRVPASHPKPTPLPAGRRCPGRGKDGRVRLGFLSSDLRQHSVSFFLEPILRHLDRGRFEIICFSNAHTVDHVTRRFQCLVAGENESTAAAVSEGGQIKNWRRVASMNADALCRQIHDDRIDVLIDLNGLTFGTRADVLRLKPAPVQVTYLGYPATTGIPTVDYRIVDSITDPIGCEDAAVEKLLRLDPCFLCYQPPAGTMDSPEPPMPSTDSGIIFGSFNNLMKFNDDLARIWTQLLQSVPGSRLIMKAASLGDQRVNRQTAERFAKFGLDTSRLTLLGVIPEVKDHLQAYGRMHIALDTFPYAGTTTTVEALLMGTPIVTLAPPSPGAMHAHRVGASLLSAVGLPELVATTPEQYIAIAKGLATDLPRLTALRAGLRRRLLDSVLCDQPAFTRRFEGAIEQMWDAYVRGTR